MISGEIREGYIKEFEALIEVKFGERKANEYLATENMQKNILDPSHISSDEHLLHVP